METRRIGGLEVSVAGLGCNNFGRRLGRARTRAVVDAAVDAGVNFFDTADIYGGGGSEELLGRALGSARGEVVVATKFGMGPPPDGRPGGHPTWVDEAAEASLRRLGTDHSTCTGCTPRTPRTSRSGTPSPRWTACDGGHGARARLLELLGRPARRGRRRGGVARGPPVRDRPERVQPPAGASRSTRCSTPVAATRCRSSRTSRWPAASHGQVPAGRDAAAGSACTRGRRSGSSSSSSDEQFDTVDDAGRVRPEHGHTLPEVRSAWLASTRSWRASSRARPRQRRCAATPRRRQPGRLSYVERADLDVRVGAPALTRRSTAAPVPPG